MKQSDIITLKRKIITQINTKLTRLDTSKKDLLELEHGAADQLDQSQSAQTLETINRLNDTLITDIQKLKLALKNINSDDFGYCDTCGIENEDRVKNNPAVTACFECQTFKEKDATKRKVA